MATLRSSRKPLKLTIDKFYGLNLTGETQLKVGESPNMSNCFITDNYDLEKMYGYSAMFKTTGKTINGVWHGFLGGIEHFLFATNGHIYKLTNDYWKDDLVWETINAFTTHCTDLGTLTDDKTRFFSFNDKVYMQNGTEYKVWNGTGNIADVIGYVPKIRVSCAPASGAGTEYELSNLLNGKKHQTYNGDNIATVYQLAEISITSVDAVYVGGVLKTLTTDYTVNITNGTVTFVTGSKPPVGLDNVDIYWTKGTGTRATVTAHKAAVEFKNRIFMYGNSNQMIWTSLANGIPSAEYFPTLNSSPIGNSNSPITDITKGYDRLVITKPNKAFYCLYDSYNLGGTDIVNFPVYDLNDTVGNIAFAQGQVIDNYPVTIENGIQQWLRTDVKDERNVEDISIRIKRDLNALDLSMALTIDFQERNEYWFIIGTYLYIYNYGIYGFENNISKRGVFSRIVLKDVPTCLLVVDKEIYFGTSTTIMKFSESFLTFNGQTIAQHYETGFMDFGANYLTKTLDKVWVGLQPQTKTRAEVSFITDIKLSDTYETITYQHNLFTLGYVDFSDFSFSVSTNPQPKALKIKAKKFTYLKMVIDNNSATETCKLLNITLNIMFGGESK